MNISDTVQKIISYLPTKNKLNLLSISKFYYNLTKRISFDETVNLNKIFGLQYFNNFSNIITDSIPYVTPKNMTHLTFGFSFNQPIANTIPNNVTHLTFGWKFNKSITNIIPNSVTHLTFIGKFNQLITIDTIPNSVSHLTFGTYFNQPITNIIPNSVTSCVTHAREQRCAVSHI